MSNVVDVWAPSPSRVELLVGDRRVPMEHHDEVWITEVDEDLSEVPYGFSLDGGPLRPDPKSEFQPQGVHGPSLRVRHDEFDWSDERFRQVPLSAAIFYEAHIGTFSKEGTFLGALEHLDHLGDLGITHLELMPVAEFSGSRGWGYDGVDLFAPHHAYGGPDDLKRLVDACHDRDIAVVLDVVYNHLGPEGNYLREFGPYFTDRYSTPWGDAINFDGPGSSEVRSFFLENIALWLRDYHFDGLRLDAVHSYYDASATHILEEFAGEARRLESVTRRPLLLIAETDKNDPRIITSKDAGGYGIDGQWNDDYHHALHVAATKEERGYYQDYQGLVDLGHALEHNYVLDGDYSSHRGRAHGRPAGHLDSSKMVVFLQNHDHVGNRAQGERITQLVDGETAAVAAGLVLLSPFVPLLFQGEEWGAGTPFLYFTNHGDPGLGEAVSKGRRSEFADFVDAPEFVPDPQELSTFERSKLRWEELDDKKHQGVLAYYRTLIQLRRLFADLGAGNDKPIAEIAERGEVIQVLRGGFLIVASFINEHSEAHASLRLPPEAELILAKGNYEADDEEIRLSEPALLVFSLL
mgnify:FL=1